MKEEKLHNIIDLYFEAQLSRSEEDELLGLLLAFKGEDEKAEEALAVMLMARNPSMLYGHSGQPVLKPGFKMRPSGFRFLRRVVAVAALAVISCTTALLYHFHHNHGVEIEGMMAYVGGVKISDQSEIMKIVDDQLNDISVSSQFFSQTIVSDLDDISNAFNEEGI